MKGRGLRGLVWSVVLLLTVAVSAAAGPGYSVKLKSGASYVVTQTDNTTFTVTKPNGTAVGSIHRSGTQFEAFDTGGHSLGTAAHINPDAVSLIDAHLAGGL